MAAAVTFDAVPSVNSVSPGPCRMVAGSGRAVDAVAVAVFELELEPEAAPARWDPARMPPASRPAPISPADPSHLRLNGRRGALPWVSMCFPLSSGARCAGSKGMVRRAALSLVRAGCEWKKRRDARGERSPGPAGPRCSNSP